MRYVALFFGFMAVGILLIVLFIPSGPQRESEYQASWAAWGRERAAEGCKVTGFVANGPSRVREVWSCPDGRSELGRQR